MPPRRGSDFDRVMARKKKNHGDPSGDARPPFLSPFRREAIRRNLHNRDTYPTRFYHEDTMNRLFAHSHLQRMFRNIGWENFLNRTARSYPLLTLEFLCTYAYNVEQRWLTFDLLGQNHMLTFDQVNDAMGVDLHQGPLADRFSLAYYEFKKEAKTQFYQYISRDTGEFNSKKRDYWIVHPIWVLTHLILSTSLTSRRETGQLNSNELFIMYCMYKKFPVDFCDFFLEKCDLLRNRRTGDIGVGGLVTLIAQAVNLDFAEVREQAKGTDDDIFLTFNVLHTMRLVNPNHNGLDWCTANEADSMIKHPCFELTQQFMEKFKPTKKSTWKPKFHYEFPTVQSTRVQDRGQSSRGRGADESDEDMEMGENVEVNEEAEEEDPERDEDDDYPLGVYQQLGRLQISNRNLLRNQEQITTRLQDVANTQAAMQHQLHDIWSVLRPEGGYPSYPQYQTPPGSYPYPPPPGGYPPYPYYQPPSGGPSQ
ncbi:hypothetical protein LXL04_037386 [Taraxacum kok-saghyz]